MQAGHPMEAQAIAREIADYKDFLLPTGGGVTVTGGEPLLQQEFVAELFSLCHAMGVPTALDTSGYLGRKVSPALLDVTDLVLLDIKSFDPLTYRRVTQTPLQPVLDFAQLCADRALPMWIRCVVVPGLTDNLETFEQLALFLKPLGHVQKIEILPFHKMGEPKWAALGLSYELADTPPPEPALVTAVRDVFLKHGFTVQ